MVHQLQLTVLRKSGSAHQVQALGSAERKVETPQRVAIVGSPPQASALLHTSPVKTKEHETSTTTTLNEHERKSTKPNVKQAIAVGFANYMSM
jgi:hypothetical protein